MGKALFIKSWHVGKSEFQRETAGTWGISDSGRRPMQHKVNRIQMAMEKAIEMMKNTQNAV